MNENTTNTATAETLVKLGKLIAIAERMRGAYFFTPPKNARGRRDYENYNSVKMLEWTERGHHYTAEFETSCSCANVYAKGRYTRDGQMTTLTAIRNSYNRMCKD